MNIIFTEKQNCRDCYKCLRRCPVRAVRIHEGHAQVDWARCLGCGSCLRVCPQKAIRLASAVGDVKSMLDNGEFLVASITPQLNNSLKYESQADLAAMLSKIGFSVVEELYPAIHLLAREYQALLESTSEPLIASLCPSIVKLMEKYFPNRLSHTAKLVSPPIVHARMLKARIPPPQNRRVRVIHLTTCPSMKQELFRPGNEESIDGVLTVGELEEWFAAEGVTPGERRIEWGYSSRTDNELCDSLIFMAEYYGARRIRTNDLAQSLEFLELFPYNMRNFRIADLRACTEICPYSLAVGAGSQVVRAGKPMILYENEGQDGECESAMEWSRKNTIIYTREFIADPLRAPVPSEDEIREILARIGIYREEDENDCGACGYNTCREKAVAVYQGMAEIEMCMPYMKRQAAHSYSIIEHSPNAIIMVNHRGLIQFANPAFHRIFKCRDENVIGKQVKDYVRNDCFERAILQGGTLAEKFAVADLDLYLRAEIFSIEGEDLVGSVIVDISEEERSHREFLRVKEETLHKAQEVIGRQMCTAQEIASLLGETTADTKVLLVKLMKLFQQEGQVSQPR